MKGISPLIAAVLLIAFTVAIGGIVSVFFTSFTKQTTGSVSSQGQQLITCSGSNPSVDRVSYPATGTAAMNVSYSNPSSYNITNITIYTTLSNGTTFTTGGTSYLNPGQANSTVLFNVSTSLGTPSVVKVAGVCQAIQPVIGTCVAGYACMVAV
jgi:flagellin-like protein